MPLYQSRAPPEPAKLVHSWQKRLYRESALISRLMKKNTPLYTHGARAQVTLMITYTTTILRAPMILSLRNSYYTILEAWSVSTK